MANPRSINSLNPSYGVVEFSTDRIRETIQNGKHLIGALNSLSPVIVKYALIILSFCISTKMLRPRASSNRIKLPSC